MNGRCRRRNRNRYAKRPLDAPFCNLNARHPYANGRCRRGFSLAHRNRAGKRGGCSWPLAWLKHFYKRTLEERFRTVSDGKICLLAWFGYFIRSWRLEMLFLSLGVACVRYPRDLCVRETAGGFVPVQSRDLLPRGDRLKYVGV